MRVALVHDYLSVYGGAERVLEALCELYPEAPIYTAFMKSGSEAAKVFEGREIVESFAASWPGFRNRMHSPLRFLIPYIWESFNLDKYDVVISSTAAYISKGVLTRPETLHVSYIHTPPRSLYGYDTDFSLRKYGLVKLYAALVSKKLRQFDYISSQRVDVLVANSQEVAGRIGKYYGRESEVIYPPVNVDVRLDVPTKLSDDAYFLAGGRLVGTKNFDVIVKACSLHEISLKIYGDGPKLEQLRLIAGETVTFCGRVSEDELSELYQGARGYIAMARDEDFGITLVEAQAHGIPVICYRGGGHLETVVEGKTGVFVDTIDMEVLAEALLAFRVADFKKTHILSQAKSFSKERFMERMRSFVSESYAEYKGKYA